MTETTCLDRKYFNKNEQVYKTSRTSKNLMYI